MNLLKRIKKAILPQPYAKGVGSKRLSACTELTELTSLTGFDISRLVKYMAFLHPARGGRGGSLENRRKMSINQKYLAGETGGNLGRYLVEAIERQVAIAEAYPGDPDVQKSTIHAMSQAVGSWCKLQASAGGDNSETSGLDEFLRSLDVDPAQDN